MHSHRSLLDPGAEEGIASVLLLFAMSTFSVLGVAALSTTLGAAPEGRTFSILRTIPRDALTHFIAPMEVPNDWRTAGASGTYRFQLPVVVPETGSDETGASSAWHAMREVPGMAVCCESRPGVCSERFVGSGGERIADWTPGADDALWLSFDLASRPDATPGAASGDTVTATVVSPAAVASAEGTPVACQLEFDGAVIAKGHASLRELPRDDGAELRTGPMTGSLTLAVKTR